MSNPPVNNAAALPVEVLAVFNQFFTAEVTTIGKNGYPVSWPVLPVFEPKSFQFVIMTSIGLAQKAINIRRDRRVSLLYSESTGSGLLHPPSVMVQGEADVLSDEPLASLKGLDSGLLAVMKTQGRRLMRLQPGMRAYLSNPISRHLMDWYFMRLVITVRPRRISWWGSADFSQAPESVEVENVG
jgi:hypothetical protein